MKDDDALRSWLGLDADAAIETLVEDAAPAGASLGFVQAAAAEPDDATILAALGDLDLVDSTLCERSDALQARWWRGRPGVMVLDVAGEVTDLAGDARPLSDGRVVLGWSGAPGAARLELATGERWIVFARAGRAQLGVSPDRPLPAWLAAGRAATVVPPLPALKIEALRAFEASPPWLRALARELVARGDATSIVAAVGSLARLHVPSSTEDPTHATRELVAWCEQLGEARRDPLETSALDECAALCDALDALDLDDGDQLSLQAAMLVRRRDELASVDWVLGVAGGRERLSVALGALDDRAEDRLGHLVGVLPLDPRVKAVAWREPDAWWGALAVL